MGWISINEDLAVYSLTDEFLMLFNWIVKFLEELSPMYYIILLLGIFVFFIISMSMRIKTLRRIAEN